MRSGGRVPSNTQTSRAHPITEERGTQNSAEAAWLPTALTTQLVTGYRSSAHSFPSVHSGGAATALPSTCRSRLIDVCIIHTCIKIKAHRCMHHTYIHQDQGSYVWIHASWTHLRGSHGLSARRVRRTKSRRPEGPQTRSWGPEGPLNF